ncbi:MAG: hypothetical protein ACLSHU_04070 [Oscillospiraceae bacterium]
MLFGINNGHKRLSDWAMPHLPLSEDAYVLDVGCGGGANFARSAEALPEGARPMVWIIPPKAWRPARRKMKKTWGFWQILAMLYLMKAFDIICFDWFL